MENVSSPVAPNKPRGACEAPKAGFSGFVYSLSRTFLSSSRVFLFASSADWPTALAASSNVLSVTFLGSPLHHHLECAGLVEPVAAGRTSDIAMIVSIAAGSGLTA